MAKESEIKIRKATLKDCDDVYNFGSSKEFRNPTGNPPKKWWVQAFVKEKQLFFVVEKDKKVIGFVLGERTTGNVAILHEIYIMPKYRDHGIGDRLLKAFQNECKKRKIKAILLYGYSDPRTIKFWKSEHYSKGSKVYEMLKFLNLKKR